MVRRRGGWCGVEKDEEKGGKNFRDNRKAEGKNRREREECRASNEGNVQGSLVKVELNLLVV